MKQMVSLRDKKIRKEINGKFNDICNADGNK
jgi:hypothetical protein